MDDATRIDMDLAEIAGCASHAFMQNPQVDGPPVGCYEHKKDGAPVRFAYQTFAWRHQDKSQLIQQVASFAAGLKGKAIVWRWRPEFSYRDGQ